MAALVIVEMEAVDSRVMFKKSGNGRFHEQRD
jgi:hypothetical protein